MHSVRCGGVYIHHGLSTAEKNCSLLTTEGEINDFLENKLLLITKKRSRSYKMVLSKPVIT